MKNVTKVVYAILTVVFKVPALETIISVIGDSNVVLATTCKVFYAFAIGAAIVKGLAKVNEFIHPNKKTHMLLVLRLLLLLLSYCGVMHIAVRTGKWQKK